MKNKMEQIAEAVMDVPNYKICSQCGNEYGKPVDRPVTFNPGRCDFCYANRSVTHYRYYGYPEKKVKDEK